MSSATVTELREIRAPENMVLWLKSEDYPFSHGRLEADCAFGEGWWVSRVYVLAQRRNRGHATQLMTRFCQIMDELGEEAYLVPQPYDPRTSYSRLVTFYERFGFRRTFENDTWVYRRYPNDSLTAEHDAQELAVAA